MWCFDIGQIYWLPKYISYFEPLFRSTMDGLSIYTIVFLVLSTLVSAIYDALIDLSVIYLPEDYLF